jgi:hypothetical protein
MRWKAAFVLASLLFTSGLGIAADHLTPEELIAKHLDSIGTAEMRAKRNAIAVFGRNSFDGLSTATGHIEGTAKLVSEGERFQYLSEFKSQSYEGESIGWTGKDADSSSFGQLSISKLAVFFKLHPYFIRDGLFGGVLNSAWAMKTISSHPPKLRMKGIKKYNGRQLLQVIYDPKKSEGHLYVKLYFDPETYQHVATVYLMDEIPIVEERFSDFKTIQGLTLPQHWEIYLTEPVQSLVLRWNIQLTESRVLDSLPK